MKHLFDPQVIEELQTRISLLSEESLPLWGKMNVSQMLVHCVEVLRNAMGEIQQKRKFIGYFVAPFLKHRYYDEVPYKRKNVPTTFGVSASHELTQAQANLISWIQKFHEEGQEKSQHAVHPILGKFEPQQWAIGQYKHIDHHLRQFGV